MDYAKLKSTIFKNTGYLFTSNVIVAALSFIINVILVRQLGASDNGLIVLTISASGMISLFFDLRFGEAVIKYTGDFMVKGEKDRALAIILIGYAIDIVLGAVCFLLIVIFRHPMSSLLNHPDLAKMLFIYSFIILTGTINNTSINIAYSFKDMKWVSFQSIMAKILDFIFIIYFVFMTKSAVGVIYAYLISSLIITVVISTNACVRINKCFHKIKPRFNGINFKELSVFIFHTTFASSIKSVIRYFDILVVGYFKDPRVVTYYKNGLTLSSLIGLISDPIYKALFPVIVELKNRNDLLTIKKIAGKVSFYGCLFGIPCALLISAFAPTIVGILYKGMSEQSASVLRLIIWVQVLNLVLCWQRPVYLAFGRSDIGSKIGLLGFIIFTVMLIILVPRFSYIGAGIAYLVTNALNLILINFNTCKIIREYSLKK